MKPLVTTTSFLVLAAALLLPIPVRAQEYKSSVVGTEFDFITDADPSAFEQLEYEGQALSEMPDKTSSAPLRQQAFVFASTYSDGARIRIYVDADFETEAAAREEALRYTPRLGRLPTALRQGVERLVVHRGGEDATAFADVGVFAIYSDNATKRIATHDLEETIFHESVHAAWDREHARSDAWREAQRSDGTFLTRYAKNNPDGEDLAESALFAYTLLHHPERIPQADADRIRAAIPARIAFVATLIPPGEPVFYAIERNEEPQAKVVGCRLDAQHLATAAGISDIVSNALNRGLDQEGSAVRSFLDAAQYEHSTADELIAAAARRFGLDEAAIKAAVAEYLHCNCKHGEAGVAVDRDGQGEREEGRRVENVGCVLSQLDLTTGTGISDILSNALMRGLGQNEPAVKSFLTESMEQSTADELIAAAARRFDLDEPAIKATVEEYLHCNCEHGEAGVVAISKERAKPMAEETRLVTAVERGGGATLSARGVSDPSGDPGPTLTRLVALLLFLLLAVNLGILVTLLRQSRTIRALAR